MSHIEGTVVDTFCTIGSNHLQNTQIHKKIHKSELKSSTFLQSKRYIRKIHLCNSYKLNNNSHNNQLYPCLNSHNQCLYNLPCCSSTSHPNIRNTIHQFGNEYIQFYNSDIELSHSFPTHHIPKRTLQNLKLQTLSNTKYKIHHYYSKYNLQGRQLYKYLYRLPISSTLQDKKIGIHYITLRKDPNTNIHHILHFHYLNIFNIVGFSISTCHL